jgi:hypothetical protein
MSVYYDYIKIPTITTESEDEIVQGLGGASGGGGASGYWGSEYDPVVTTPTTFPTLGSEAETLLEAYVSDAENWLIACIEDLQLGIQQFEAGDPVTVDEPEAPPELDISIAFDWGAAVDIALWVAKIVFKVALWWAYNWFVERIRRLKGGAAAEIPEELVNAVKDLAFADAIVDFGGFKVHVVGKALRK